MNQRQTTSPDLFQEPEDDGLPMRPSGRWVAEKLFFLERYLHMFSIAMSGKPWRAVNYIDLFAGSGKCRVRDDGKIHLGSPLLALTAPRPFTNYFFADADAGSIEVLKQRCGASPFSDRIRYYVGDSNVRVRELVDLIQQVDAEYRSGEWPSLNLAFLDPEGLELQWETVAALAEVRTDLIIHYSEMGIARNAPNCVEESGETVLDRFFGAEDWRDIYKSAQSPALLLEYYMSKLRQIGYKEVRRADELWSAPLIRSTGRRAPLYRLLFASKSPLGHKFWRQVTSKDVYGQRRLF
jgi:three-Cys-motif partner protein